jgi:hypothetical protein
MPPPNGGPGAHQCAGRDGGGAGLTRSNAAAPSNAGRHTGQRRRPCRSTLGRHGGAGPARPLISHSPSQRPTPCSTAPDPAPFCRCRLAAARSRRAHCRWQRRVHPGAGPWRVPWRGVARHRRLRASAAADAAPGAATGGQVQLAQARAPSGPDRPNSLDRRRRQPGQRRPARPAGMAAAPVMERPAAPDQRHLLHPTALLAQVRVHCGARGTARQP